MALKAVLILAAGIQAIAAIIAVREMKWSGEFRTAWGCIAAALILMVERRIHSFLYADARTDLRFEAMGVLISLLMLVGLSGIQSLFRKLRKNEEDLLRQHAEVEHLAFIDQLSLLPNRRGFLSRANREVRRAARTSRPVSLLMLDLDNLKAINDTHGHSEGDAALAKVGAVIANSLREVDVPGRYGGDEFIILLPETPHEEAVAVAERLRQEIAATTTATAPISVSIGLATVVSPTESLTLDILLRQADEALYASKTSGRNRVTTAPLRAT